MSAFFIVLVESVEDPIPQYTHSLLRLHQEM